MGAPYTLDQLRVLVWRELQDPLGVYFSRAIVNDFLNEAQHQFVRATRCLRVSNSVIPLVYGQAEYDLSSLTPRAIELLSVSCPQSSAITSPIALTYTSWEELEAMDTLWRVRQGNPRRYMRYNEGPQKIRVYPIPSLSLNPIAMAPAVGWDGAYGMIGSVSGIDDATWTATYGLVSSTGVQYGALTLDYVAAPTDMSDDTDQPSTPPDTHEALRDYAVARCLLMDTPLKQIEKAALYMQAYQAGVDRWQKLAAGGFQHKPARSVTVREY